MKILLLNPDIDARHQFCTQLQEAGAVLLLSADVEEAWKMIHLHGTSLDLAVIHREVGQGDAGCGLITRIKADPTHADLPIILTSNQWNEGDFFLHQQSPQGVNAYLRWPLEAKDLIGTIEAMFGTPMGSMESTKFTQIPSTPVVEEPIASSAAPSGILPEVPEMAPIELGSAPGEIKLELSEPPVLNLGMSSDALSLSAPSTELAPPQTPAQAEGATKISLASAPISESGSLDISELMIEDLEPHERLMLDQDKKEAPVSESAMGTRVLETGEIGLVGDKTGLQITPQAPKVAEAPEPVLDQAAGIDEEIASELPYLFNRKTKGDLAQGNPALVFAEPVGDAVVPGGAVHAPDIETLKKYLQLREQDVAILSNLLKSAKEQVIALEKQAKEEKGVSLDLNHSLGEHKRRIEEFEKEKALALDGLFAEIEELKFQNKSKADKARVLESQVREATDEIERLKERVRNDIRKIRVRERELENKLEIVVKDSEALIAARESKIIELKRKNDLLEFNMDLLQDQYSREKENSAQLRERLAKAAQVVRVAGGLLDSTAKNEGEGEREAS